MKNAIRRTARWMFISAPGVGVLVVSAGLGIGYAATNSGSGTSTQTEPPHAGAGFLVGPDQNLSAADKAALEKFQTCMRDNITPPSGSNPPDPTAMRKQVDAAFEKCKSELPASLRTQYEQRQQQMDAFRSCMDANGAKPPSPGTKPSQSEIDAMQKAQKACADKLPKGAGSAICVAGGPGGPGGPPGVRGGGPPPFGPPPSGSSSKSQSYSN